MKTRVPLSESKQAIAESVFPLLLKIAERHAERLPYLREEFLSAAGETACQVARLYDPACGAKLKTYASQRMNGACLDVMRSCGSMLGLCRTGGRRPYSPPPVGSIHHFDPAEGNRFDMPSDDLPVGWEVESEDAVLTLTQRLPAPHREAIRKKLLHAATRTFGPLAAELGLSSSRANQLCLDGTDMLAGRPPRYEVAV